MRALLTIILLACLVAVFSCIANAFLSPSSMMGLGSLNGGGPSVPPAAQLAGFTTLAANYDFSQPTYATQSNWLGCYSSGSGFPTGPFQWYQGQFFDTAEPPCNINQVIDTLDNTASVKIVWLPSYAGFSNFPVNVITTQNHTGSNFKDFPLNSLWEFRYRASSNEIGGVSGQWNDVNCTDHGSCGASTEYDNIEINNYSAGVSPDSNIVGTGFIWSGAGSLPSGWDQTVYNTYTLRITSDGSTYAQACSYLNNSFINCLNNAVLTGNALTQRNVINIEAGQQNSQAVASEYDIYLRFFRVWSCNNWATQQCNIPGSAPPH